MRFATLKNGSVAAVTGDGMVILDHASMADLAASCATDQEAVERAVSERAPVGLDLGQLAAPVPRPSKI